VLVINDSSKPLLEGYRMIQIRDAHAMHPSDLIPIARPNPPPSRAKMVGHRRRFLSQSLLFKVIRKNHMCPVADMQPLADLDPLSAQGANLIQERRRMNHHPITNDGVNPLPKDPRRHE